MYYVTHYHNTVIWLLNTLLNNNTKHCFIMLVVAKISTGYFPKNVIHANIGDHFNLIMKHVLSPHVGLVHVDSCSEYIDFLPWLAVSFNWFLIYLFIYFLTLCSCYWSEKNSFSPSPVVFMSSCTYRCCRTMILDLTVVISFLGDI